MDVRLATGAGTAGKPNEDFVGAVPGAVVLLDGAGIPGSESICVHGVAWYTHRLGGALLGRLSGPDGDDLAALLASSIAEIAAEHRDTCDLADPSSPQATVAIVRAFGERLDHLLLADSFLVLELPEGPLVLTDDREATARRTCAEPLTGVARGSAEYERIRATCIQAMRSRRNRPGGYWIAKDDPLVAQHAVIGSQPIEDVCSVALLSNGASRVVDPHRVTDWSGVLDLLGSAGPDEIIRLIRDVEATASNDPEEPAPDDATVAYWVLSSRSGSGADSPGLPPWRP